VIDVEISVVVESAFIVVPLPPELLEAAAVELLEEEVVYA
jgi:hypothetical protein